MASRTFHTIYAPLPVAAGRMPSLVRTDAGVVALTGAADPLTWQWQSSNAGGRVQLSPLDADTSRLTVTTEGPGSVSAADALTVVLYGVLERQWAPVSPGPAVAIGRRTKFGLAVAAVLVPVLALTGVRILAPPAPMDVATAVAQFRDQSAQPSPEVTVEPNNPDRAQARSPAEGANPGGGGVTRREPQRQRRNAVAPARPLRRTTAAPGAADRGSATRSRNAAQPPQSSATAAPRQQTSSADPRRRPAQEQAPPKKQPIATSPEEGVYRYATDGYESIDRPSSRHDYPSETAMSIRATDCGFTARWQPLENRWDEMSVCRSGGEALLPRLSTHREFYGQENDTNYECGPTNYAYRPQPGAAWVGRCSDGDAKMEIRGRTIGVEPMRVGDETVETVHYTLEARISGGDAQGTWTAQRWVDPDTGLLVRVEARTSATSQSSVGAVQYQEELTLQLLSTTPER